MGYVMMMRMLMMRTIMRIKMGYDRDDDDDDDDVRRRTIMRMMMGYDDDDDDDDGTLHYFMGDKMIVWCIMTESRLIMIHGPMIISPHLSSVIPDIILFLVSCDVATGSPALLGRWVSRSTSKKGRPDRFLVYSWMMMVMMMIIIMMEIMTTIMTMKITTSCLHLIHPSLEKAINPSYPTWSSLLFTATTMLGKSA